MVRLCRVATLCFGVLLSGFANAEIWPTQHAWDDQYENAFSEFIKKTPLDVFNNSRSEWNNISTDCSKAVYILRVIFAWQNGLPVKFTNWHGLDLSNASTQFDAVPEGKQRLMKFINLVRNSVNTETLVKDTYPIAINRKTLRSGAIFLHPQAGKTVPLTYRSGHVYYIQDVLENGMIKYVSSTVPMMVRDLQPRLEIVFAPFTEDGGYRAWKRPDSSVRRGESQEQFQLAGWRPNVYGDTKFWRNWQSALRSRLAVREATLKEELDANVYNIRGYIKERTQLVKAGWRLYNSKYRGQACLNEKDYDDYSTPTRDVKIQSELAYLRRAAVKYLESEGESTPYQALPYLFEKYTFEVLPGTEVDLNHLWTTFQSRKVLAISEPEHSPSVRWGLENQAKWPCPHRAKQYKGGESVGE